MGFVSVSAKSKIVTYVGFSSNTSPSFAFKEGRAPLWPALCAQLSSVGSLYVRKQHLIIIGELRRRPEEKFHPPCPPPPLSLSPSSTFVVLNSSAEGSVPEREVGYLNFPKGPLENCNFKMSFLSKEEGLALTRTVLHCTRQTFQFYEEQIKHSSVLYRHNTFLDSLVTKWPVCIVMLISRRE